MILFIFRSILYLQHLRNANSFCKHQSLQSYCRCRSCNGYHIPGRQLLQILPSTVYLLLCIHLPTRFSLLREAGFLLFSFLILFPFFARSGLSLVLSFDSFSTIISRFSHTFHVSFLFTAQATVRHNQLPHLTIKRLPCVSNLCLIINILDKNYCLCYDCSIWSFSETTIMSLSDDDLNEYWREYT